MREPIEGKCCCICGKPATRIVRLGPIRKAFCEMDYMLVRQGVSNLANIGNVLRDHGINIGVPKGVFGGQK